MNTGQWLETLGDQGIELWVEGDRLRFRAPKGMLGPQQRSELAARRGEVIAWLRVQAAAREFTQPLSFSQRSLWFMHQQAPGSAAYHVAFAARVVSRADPSALRHALQALVDRHAVLRTVYEFDGTAPVQRIRGDVAVDFAIHEVPGVEDAALRRAVQVEYARPFDLERGPVFRAALFRRGPEDHVLLLTVHHIAADGWSLLLLIDELRRLHAEATGGPAAALGRPIASYADYAAWQAQTLEGAEGERLWAYWRGKLAAPRAALVLPSDRPRPALSSFRGASLALSIDAEASAALRDLARAQSATPFVVLLATFHAFLHALTGNDDVIVGTPTFSRSKAEFMDVVGDFVNSVPLRSRLASTMRFRDLVAQLRETVLGALDAQDYPLPLLVQRLQPERERNRSPLFDTFFALQRFDRFRELEQLLVGTGDASVEFGGLRLAPFALDQQEGQFDLALQMLEQHGVFHAVFKYSTDLFDESTVRRFATAYLDLVRAVVRDPDVKLHELASLAVQAAPQDPAAELLADLAGKDIRLALDGDKLRVNAPKGALDDALKARIGAHRDALVQALRRQPSPATATGHPEVRVLPRDVPLPVSSAQQRLWFLDRIDPGRSHYNIGVGLDLRGVLDDGALQRALEAVAARHESLRTRFVEVDGVPMADVADVPPTRLERVDLSTRAAQAGRDAEALRLAEEHLKKPFDLAAGPMSAWKLIRMAPDHHVLSVSVHHIAADGWSLMIVLRELWQAYEAVCAGKAPAWTPLTVQNADHAAWEREYLHEGRMAPHLAYWKQQLADAPGVLELPTDHPRPPVQSFRGGRLRRDLDVPLLEALKAQSRRHDVTLYMLLLAAWQVLLHRYSGQEDIVVGSPVANRSLPDFEPMVGCLINNIVLRGRLQGNPTFADFLAQVKQTTLGRDRAPRPAFRRAGRGAAARTQCEPRTHLPGAVHAAVFPDPLHAAGRPRVQAAGARRGRRTIRPDPRAH